MSFKNQVQKAYLAYYGRPADPDGLNYWVDRLESSDGDIQSIIDAFGNSDEANVLYGSTSIVERVTKVYNQLFNRNPEEGGLNYWVSRISSNEVSLSEAAIAIQGGAQNDDLLMTENKLIVANTFTDTLVNNLTLKSQYNGEQAASASRKFIKGVSHRDSSVEKSLDFLQNASNTNNLIEEISATVNGVSIVDSIIGDRHVDLENSVTFAWAKPQGLVYNDFDKDGDTDVMFFPSNFTKAVHIPIAIFLNDGNGKFSYSENFVTNELPYEFVRDVIEGDFDNDGDTDYVLLDTGWELESRDSSQFKGATIKYLEQTDSGLKMSDLGISTKSFNHTGDSGDINGDGKLDFVAANFGLNSKSFGVYIGNGNGTFTFNQSAGWNVFNYNSGAAIVEINGVEKVAVGSYRGWQNFPDTLNHDIEIFGWQNGRLVFEQSLPRPFDSTYGRNYGVSNMFNQDINGDGREDLIVAWETEADLFNGSNLGFQDGIAPEKSLENPMAPALRYGKIGLENQIWVIYEQDNNGKFALTDVMNGTGFGSAVEMRFIDIDEDGDIDMYNNNHGSNPNKWNLNWFINDGQGNFSHPDPFDISELRKFESWERDVVEFFDANNDGYVDVVALNVLFPSDIARGQPNNRAVGASIDTYLSENFVPVVGVNSIDTTVSQFLPFGG